MISEKNPFSYSKKSEKTKVCDTKDPIKIVGFIETTKSDKNFGYLGAKIIREKEIIYQLNSMVFLKLA